MEESSGKRLSNHPWVILVGLIASLIGIVTFVTGKQRLSDFFGETRPQEQQTDATTTPVENSSTPGKSDILSDDTSRFRSPKSRPSAASTQDSRSPEHENLTSGRQRGHESPNPSSRVETQPTEIVDARSTFSAPGFAADERQDKPGVHIEFQVLPKDTSIYLDSKFIGTADELSGGTLVPTGRHVVKLVRPGYESQEYKVIFDQGVKGVRVTLTPQR